MVRYELARLGGDLGHGVARSLNRLARPNRELERNRVARDSPPAGGIALHEWRELETAKGKLMDELDYEARLDERVHNAADRVHPLV